MTRPAPAPPRPSPPSWAVPGLLGATGCAGALAAAPLFSGATAVVVTAAATACVATVLAAATGRMTALRTRWTCGAAVLAAGLIGAALCGWWLVVPSTTLAGIPGAGSIRALVAGGSATLAAVGHAQPPVQTTPDLRLAFAVTAGSLVALAQAMWATFRRPLPALAPLGVILLVAAALTQHHDLLATAAWLAAAVLVLLAAGQAGPAHRAAALTPTATTTATTAPAATEPTATAPTATAPAATTGTAAADAPAGALAAAPTASPTTTRPTASARRRPPGARRSSGPPARHAVIGSALAALAVAAGVLAGTAPLAGSRLTIHRHVAAAPQTLVVGTPSADLLPVKIHLAQTKVFSVTSPHASYWQLTTLDTYTGTGWIEGRGGARAEPPPSPAGDGPAVARRGRTAGQGPATGRGTLTLVQQVQVQGLDSPWLPAAPVPTTVTVTGVGAAHVNPVSGEVVRDVTPDRYRVTSSVTAMSAGELAALPAPAPARWLQPYLRLPHQPAVAVHLAHHLVAGASGPYRRALALVRFFTSGRFRYTLAPPPYPARSNPLMAFLTVTRAGYCQQFASAFAVLARLDGLPTRLAVGFTTGEPTGHDTYQVTGADAHVWPEVYLGATAGWVSFEPTPPSTAAAAATPDHAVALPATPAAARAPVTPIGVQGLAHQTTRPGTRHAVRPATTPPASHHASQTGRAVAGVTMPATVAAGVIAAGATVWLAALVLSRRRRRAEGGSACDPAVQIDRAWASVTGYLARRRLGPHHNETPREYARRLAAVSDPAQPRLAPPERSGGSAPPVTGRHMAEGRTAEIAGAIGALALLVDAARYARRRPDAGDAVAAWQLACRARQAARGIPRRRHDSPVLTTPVARR
ncbi:MAG: transglutaminase-like domain-containing protein [Actinomycetota bacterium]|nr:transglutaminase-like domain-containing protein [Actinomycetota bacterium]